MHKLGFLLTFTLFCVLSAGCSRMVTVSHKPKATHSVLNGKIAKTQHILPTKVLIQPQIASSKPNKKQMGLLIAGVHNIWSVNLNEALPEAVQTAVLETYNDVEIGNHCEDCGLFFRPEIKRIDFEKVTMRATVEIEVPIYDAYNSKIASFSAVGKSPIMDLSRFSSTVAAYFIPFFGSAVGKSLIAKTSRRALNEATAKLHEKIVAQTESGVLARYWLPKWENRNYGVGDHQFHAEQLAVTEGCSLQADEIRLVKQHHHSESYIANCWDKASFEIDCEYGRCALREERRSLAQQE